MTDEQFALLLAELRGIREALAAQRPRPLPTADVAQLELLLPVLAAAIGDRIFSVAELGRHAQLAGQEALQAAIAAAGGSRAVGRLLARAAGQEAAGIAVQRVGTDRDGAMWGLAGPGSREYPQRY